MIHPITGVNMGPVAALGQPTRDVLFRQDIAAAVRKTIAKLKRQGTVGMSADNLWQVTANSLPKTNGPTGTNAAFVARQIFLEVLDDNRSFRNFVI